MVTNLYKKQKNVIVNSTSQTCYYGDTVTNKVSQGRIVYHKLSLNRNANVIFLKYSSFLITSGPFAQVFISALVN